MTLLVGRSKADINSGIPAGIQVTATNDSEFAILVNQSRYLLLMLEGSELRITGPRQVLFSAPQLQMATIRKHLEDFCFEVL